MLAHTYMQYNIQSYSPCAMFNAQGDQSHDKTTTHANGWHYGTAVALHALSRVCSTHSAILQQLAAHLDDISAVSKALSTQC